MKPNDDYTPQVGDIVQYVGKYDAKVLGGGIGVIFKTEMLYTGYSSRRRKTRVYHIRFPNEKLVLKPRFFKVIKKVEKNT